MLSMLSVLLANEVSALKRLRKNKGLVSAMAGLRGATRAETRPGSRLFREKSTIPLLHVFLPLSHHRECVRVFVVICCNFLSRQSE